MLPQIGAHRSKRCRASEISDQRHNQIVLFELLQGEEIFFRRDEAPLLSVFVRIDHQLFVCRQEPRALGTRLKGDVAVAQVGTTDIKGPEDVSQSGLVFTRYFESMFLDQTIFYRA